MIQFSKQTRVLTALALFSGIMGGFVTGAVAQTEKPVLVPSPHLMVFEQARQLGDINTAIMSLHQLLIADKDKYASYSDTLALLYFDARNYTVCNTLCTVLLAKKPANTVLMELKAASLRQLGQAVESADLYGQLFTKTQNRMVGMELMQLQFGLKRLNECLQTTDRVISQDPKEKEMQVTVPNADGKTVQNVPLNALAYYVQALVYDSQKENGKTALALGNALTAKPDFTMAQALQQKLRSTAKTGVVKKS